MCYKILSNIPQSRNTSSNETSEATKSFLLKRYLCQTHEKKCLNDMYDKRTLFLCPPQNVIDHTLMINMNKYCLLLVYTTSVSTNKFYSNG